MSDATAEPARLSRTWQALLLVACLLAFLPGITTLPPIDRDEARYVQATKQMLESGDYVDIRFQEEHRYKKPVAIYWLQSAAVRLTGGDSASSIYRYRLVSVAAASAAVLVLASLGTYMFGVEAGLAAALMLLGIFGLGFEGRVAKTDATLLAATLVVQAALARLYLGARRGEATGRGWWWTFWIAMGVGLLVKGPITPLVTGLTVAGIAIVDKDRAWLRRLRPAAGIALALLIAAPWFVAITAKTGMEFWAGSVGKDLLGKVASGQESHGAPPGYYVIVYTLYFWPFGLLAINGGLKALNRWREPAMLFCLAWYIPFWFLLELTPTKLPHYPLPAYPALMLLGGWALFTTQGRETVLRRWQIWVSRLTLLGVGVMTAAFAAIAIGSAVQFDGPSLAWSIVGAALALAAGYFASGLGRPAQSLGRVGLAAAFAAAFMVVLTTFIAPNVREMWLSPAIAKLLDDKRPCPQTRLASVGDHEPSLVFLIATDTLLTDVAGSAAHLTADAACNVAVLPRDSLAELEGLLPQPAALEVLGAVNGLNYSNGRKLDLVMVRLAP